MLVLSRKVNDEIVIDGRIRVQVLQVKGKTIRLGISAPDDVKILRGELQPFDPVSAESVEAAASTPPHRRSALAHAS
jgi:carbon storage regulator CsrA